MGVEIRTPPNYTHTFRTFIGAPPVILVGEDYIYIYIYIYKQINEKIHKQINMKIHIYIYTYTYMSNVYVYVCIYIYNIHIHVCVCIPYCLSGLLRRWGCMEQNFAGCRHSIACWHMEPMTLNLERPYCSSRKSHSLTEEAMNWWLAHREPKKEWQLASVERLKQAQGT